MNTVTDGPAVRTGGSGIFTRPTGIADGARWLFRWLLNSAATKVTSSFLRLPTADR